MKELRNQFGMRTLAALAQARIFASTTEAHLKVGHTHEDIDALFALIAGGLRSASPSSLQTPKDLARRIDEKMKPLFERKDLSWGIEVVQTVSWLQFNVQSCFCQNLQTSKFLGRFPFCLNMFEYCLSQLKVRDWVQILPDAASFKNCFRARKLRVEDAGERTPLPQMFTFMPRAGQNSKRFFGDPNGM